jgi:hypothetical protein
VVERDTPLGRWAKELSNRAHRNVAIVAFANKLAAWRTVRGDTNACGGVEFWRSNTTHRLANRCFERVTTGWPDSRTALREPGSKDGAI